MRAKPSAGQVHPDKNGAKRANEAFDRLHTAKEVLMDADAREEYVCLHPPRAAVAREWAQAMDEGGRSTWERASAANGDTQHYRSRG